jgi:Icc-related predicted phosphoesterase
VRAGSRTLRDRVLQLKPRLHVWGHIHEAYGVTRDNGYWQANASLVNEWYRPVNRPVEFEL